MNTRDRESRMTFGMTEGSAIPPLCARGLLNVTWASRPCVKIQQDTGRVPLPRDGIRRANLFVKKCRQWGVIAGLVLASFSMFQNLSAQEESPVQPGPGSKTLAAGTYTFQMLLKPEVDVTAKIKIVSKTENKNGEGDGAASPPVTVAIQRDIRPGIIRVSQASGDAGKESVRFYVGGWCVADDPRRGLNVRRPNIEGLVFPMDFYHFPELLWAEPQTRQPDPMVKEGEPKIHLYREADRFLEVDAASGLPRRFSDGTLEWTYSYRENATPLVVPEKLQAALRRVLPR